MKKILLVHTSYQNLGGEDVAVENEITLLKKHFEVETLIFSNNVQNYFSQFIYFIFNKNFKSMRMLQEKISTFKPDVVYVHNTWFKGSVGLFKILEKNNQKTVIKLHNFRYFCTKSFLSKNHLGNEIYCGACGMEKDKVGFFNKYFSDSYLKSFLVIIYGKRYFKILQNLNLDLVVLTKFHKEFLTNLGISKNRIFILPNFINTKILKQSNETPSLVYAGRISREKGVEKLIKSFLQSKLSNWKLKIIGEGPLLLELKNNYKSYKNIQFFGALRNEEVLKTIANSNAVATATLLYEGQPTLLCEASLIGVASIFPESGGIKEFFPNDYELSFDFKIDSELTAKLNTLMDEHFIDDIAIKNQNFINDYLDYDRLLDIFKDVFYDQK